VILFRRNIESAGQTRRLLAEVESLVAPTLFRCVDVEGGLVDRLRDAVAPVPSLAEVAATGKRALYRKHGKLIGREAAAFGFNTVFAPVLDLALPESAPVMRTRSYFSDAKLVAEYGGAFLSGLASAGVLGCGKHFPGLGGGTLDSHHATPIIERSWDRLWGDDLLPYRKLKAELPMAMVSHASYPAAGEAGSASISRFWITDVLTKRIGYRGLIVSDDMEMGGILTQTSIEDAAVRAVEAGTHLVEICKDSTLVLRAYEALLGEAEKSAAFRRLVEGAWRKISRAKRGLAAVNWNKSPSQLHIEKLRRKIVDFGAEIAAKASEGNR